MAGLGDSLTVGLLLLIVFGAVCFYLYSRLSQNEKRVSLLENLLLSVKMRTEAELMGPDSVEPVSGPAPLEQEDVDGVEEEEYSEMLKDIPSMAAAGPVAPAAPAVLEEDAEEEEELLRAAAAAEVPSATPRKMDVNYESMSVKELEGLAKQRGITGVPKRKRELIDALKRQGEAPPEAPQPSDSAPAELEEGFSVELESA